MEKHSFTKERPALLIEQRDHVYAKSQSQPAVSTLLLSSKCAHPICRCSKFVSSCLLLAVAIAILFTDALFVQDNMNKSLIRVFEKLKRNSSTKLERGDGGGQVRNRMHTVLSHFNVDNIPSDTSENTCSCLQPRANQTCCQRWIRRFHKMGFMLAAELFKQDKGLWYGTKLKKWKSPMQVDYRGVICARNIYEAIISGTYSKRSYPCQHLVENVRLLAALLSFSFASHTSCDISHKDICTISRVANAGSIPKANVQHKKRLIEARGSAIGIGGSTS